MKYSIIIPTYNDENRLRRCLVSVLDNTPGIGTDVEVIVVSNGCEDGTCEWVEEYAPEVKLIRSPSPLGYTKATNRGIAESRGEYMVLLNNDCEVLPFGSDGKWLEMMRAPFDEGDVAITGPSKMHSKEIDEYFIIFFCAMISRRAFEALGPLDETFNPGGGEDIDYAARAIAAGYRVVKVPYDNPDHTYTTAFPIYHEGGATVHTKVDGWEEKFWRRMSILKDRTDRGYYFGVADVTCEICTKGRSDTTLPMAIMSVTCQDVRPKRLVIYDDDPGSFDMRNSPVYRHIFALLDIKGIEWRVEFSDGVGQVRNHQRALDEADTRWVWRIDDDNYAESDVLRKLLSRFDDGVGAVAPSVPGTSADNDKRWSTKLEDIDMYDNVQWHRPLHGEDLTVEAEHLYSTFVYDRNMAVGYDTRLSKVGHREETIFTYRMYAAGQKLLVARDATVWHLQQPGGGIRSHEAQGMYSSDEAIFQEMCAKHGVNTGFFWVNLDCGMGDHVMFLSAFDRIMESRPGERVVIYSAHPDCLDEIRDRAIIKSVSEAHVSKQEFDRMNVYSWCTARKWSGHLIDAFVEMYKK